MKKLLFIFSVITILYSCNNDDNSESNTELIGSWKLIEVYADPGGGGSFEPVTSEKKITFHNDGAITSNGSICNMSIEANNSTSGIYSISDSTFNSTDCNNSKYNYKFEQNANILIVKYPCIEPCQAKYIKE